jgi:hypothetical protein
VTSLSPVPKKETPRAEIKNALQAHKFHRSGLSGNMAISMASTPTPNKRLGNSGQRPGELPSTHWSLIFAAAGTGQEAREALAKLCAIYRAPVHRFVSRRKSNPADAQEFTQQFFADLIARKDIAKVNPALGSFHAWLYRCLRNALLDSHRNSSRRPALTSSRGSV